MIYLFTIKNDFNQYSGHYFLSEEKEIIQVDFEYYYYVIEIKNDIVYFRDIPSTDIEIEIPLSKKWNAFPPLEGNNEQQTTIFKEILDSVLLSKIIEKI